MVRNYISMEHGLCYTMTNFNSIMKVKSNTVRSHGNGQTRGIGVLPRLVKRLFGLLLFLGLAAHGADYDLAAFVWPAYQPEPRWAELGIFSDGKGEWQNVMESCRRFDDDLSDLRPLWGFENEADPVVVEKKIDAAVHYGINVFIYDWYWYEGRPFLADALERGFLGARNNEKMKFFVMWANHNVSRLWDNKVGKAHKKDVVWSADVSDDDFRKIVEIWIGYFKRPNYYRINGEPVLCIYLESRFLERGVAVAKSRIDYLRRQARLSGFPGVHLMINGWPMSDLEFDSMTMYNWGFAGAGDRVDSATAPQLDYDTFTEIALAYMDRDRAYAKYRGMQYFPSLTIGWDNNSRFPASETNNIVHGTSPEAFERAARRVKEWFDANHPEGSPRLITVNSWNEWTEGSYLEPSDRLGFGFLEVVRRVFTPGIQVSVDGVSLKVETARCSAVRKNRRWPGHQRWKSETEECAFVRFDMDGPRTVEVTCPREFKEVVVKPLSKKVQVEKSGRTVRFVVPSPGGYSVEFDGFHENLHVFADPVKAYDVAKGDASVRWFGRGEHDVGKIVMKSGDTLYLDDGAVVYGRVFARDADNIRILGRGILDASRVTEEIVRMDPEKDAEERARNVAVQNVRRFDTIRLEFCDHVIIDGITIRDSQIYNIRPIGCRDVEIGWVKTVGNWRYNSDGFDMHNCERVRIHDCFLRTFDDAICVKGWDCWMDESEMYHDGYRHDVFRDVVVERCTIWNDWGKALEIGAETRAKEISGVVFRDCDVIRTSGAPIDAFNVDYADVHDIVWDDIRVEYDKEPTGQMLASIVVQQHPEYSAGGTRRGRIRDVVLCNIAVTSPVMPKIGLRGHGAGADVRNVVFENFLYNGKPLRSLDEMNVEIGEHADRPVVRAPSMALLPTAPAGVWAASERPTFKMSGLHAMPYSVVDFYGNVRERGKLPDGSGEASVGLLGPGYYSMRVSSGTNDVCRTSFTVVPDAAERGERDPETFFATMATFARKPVTQGEFAPWCGGDVDDIVSRALSMAGITEARVMWWWDRLEKQKGVFDSKAWDRAADLYRSRGIGLCAFGHSCPSWVSRSGRLPRDFTELVRFCRRMERSYGPSMTAWEFGNEPELAHFVSEGTWHFAAASKAAYLAFKAENPKRTVASAAFCTKAGSSGVDTIWYESGGAYYSDFLNLHDYEIEPLPARYAAWRDVMARYGIGGQAIWVTENGTDLEGTARVPGPDGKHYHDEWQESIHAEAGIKGEFRLMQEGVSRCYHFYFSKFHEREGRKDWGDFRHDGTLKPYFAALSTAARELKRATLLGRVCPADGVTGYLFSRDDGLLTLAYWSESDADRRYPGNFGASASLVGDKGNMYRKSFRLPVHGGSVRQTLMTGESRSVECADETVEILSTRYPAYVTGQFDMPVVEKAKPRGRLGARRPEPGLDISVVIRADESHDDFRVGSRRTRAEMLGDRGAVGFEVWNLSDTEKSGSLSWRGAALSGVPEKLVLPPWGKASFEAEVVYDGSWSNAMAKLEVCGNFNGLSTTPFVMPLFSERHFLDNRKCLELDGWREVSSWRKNDSGRSTSITWDEREGAIRVDVEFDAKTSDCWIFPRLLVKEEEMSQASGLVFEIKASQTRVENEWKATMVQLNGPENPGRTGWIRFHAPTEQWERRVVDFGGRRMGRGVKDICIGGLPVVSRKATIWIRGVNRVVAGQNVQSDAEKYCSTEMNASEASADSEARGGRRLLVLGNSIALHGIAPEIGWTNYWGMAASSAERDFAHLVWTGLERLEGTKFDCRIRNVYEAEKACGRGWDPAEKLKGEIEWSPDVVVIAIGENVPNLEEASGAREWADFLVGLGEAFKLANGSARIVYRTPFWPNEAKRLATIDAARRAGALVADIGQRGSDAAMQAGAARFAHKGVAHHPGDEGMKMIADAILGSLQQTCPKRQDGDLR